MPVMEGDNLLERGSKGLHGVGIIGERPFTCQPTPQSVILNEVPVLSAEKELSRSYPLQMYPRPGANGIGSFCRNKRTSSWGGETP